jgi:hypothetical protein
MIYKDIIPHISKYRPPIYVSKPGPHSLPNKTTENSEFHRWAVPSIYHQRGSQEHVQLSQPHNKAHSRRRIASLWCLFLRLN